jgi:hypothetical protein
LAAAGKAVSGADTSSRAARCLSVSARGGRATMLE